MLALSSILAWQLKAGFLEVVSGNEIEQETLILFEQEAPSVLESQEGKKKPKHVSDLEFKGLNAGTRAE